MSDSGFFVINDILLDIAPEQIVVQRNSINRQWRTLRTSSSIKSKSGFSSITITLKKICFTDNFETSTGRDQGAGTPLFINGYEKLRDLVSQVRMIPFCWVDNQMLRNSILNGDQEQAMVLALQEMRINKDPSSTNVIEVDMVFQWFNYFPYTPRYTFKEDLFTPSEVMEPKLSKAWKILYRAEQARKRYLGLTSLNAEDTTLRFNQFSQLPVKNYNKLKSDVDKLTKLQKELVGLENDSGVKNASISVFDRVVSTLSSAERPQDETEGAGISLQEKILGQTTSYGTDAKSNETLLQQVLKVLDGYLDQKGHGEYSLVVNPEWSIVRIDQGKAITFKDSPAALRPIANSSSPDFHPDDTLLMERKVRFKPIEHNTHVTGIHIVFEHMLSTIGLIGHPYPTFQCMGGADVSVTISMTTTSESAVKNLTAFYDLVEDQAHKNRIIPQGHRNVMIRNDLLNMLGLHYFVPDAIEVETNRSAPGTFNMFLSLLDNPLDPETTEQITTGQSFTTRHDIRLAIAKVFESHIIFHKELLGLESSELLRFGEKDKIRKERAVKDSGVKSFDIKGLLLSQFVREAVGRLLYTSDIPVEDRNSQLYEYTKQYSENLSILFGDLLHDLQSGFGEIGKNFTGAQGDWAVGGSHILIDDKLFDPTKLANVFDGISFFLLLTDNEIIGIERIQLDMVEALSKVEVFQKFFNKPPEILFNTKNFKNQELTQSLQLLKEIVPVFNEMSKVEASRSNSSIGVGVMQELRTKAKDARSTIRTSLDVSKVIRLNSTLGKWNDFILRFTDELLLGRPDLLQTEEFSTIRPMLKALALASGSDCYPDFPFRSLQTLLQNERPDLVKNLQATIVDKQLSVQNIGISSLLGPDLFMYNRVPDSTARLIPDELREAAIESIQISQGEMKPTAEENWFDTGYKNSMIHSARTTRTNLEMGSKDRDSNFWKTGEDKVRANTVSALERELYKALGPSTFVGNDLIGDLGCSTFEQESDKKPITLKAIEIPDLGDKNAKAGDQWNIVSNKRKSATLKSPDYASTVKHRFGTGAINFLSEQEYARGDPSAVNNPDRPNFIRPTDPDTQRVTSEWQLRRPHPNLKNKDGTTLVRPHLGIDIASKEKGQSVGRRCLASADGDISFITYSETHNRKNEKGLGQGGVHITIKHKGKWETKYLHLLWNDLTKELSDIYHKKGKYENISPELRAAKLKVVQGQHIASVGNTGSASKGPHLHFEIHQNGKSIDPRLVIIGGFQKSQGPTKGLNPVNESLLTRSIEGFEKEALNGQGYSMKRAWPTFKLYFIESDEGERKKYGFDDFFSYSAVKDITVIRSRKIAADLVTITLTNISGVLNNRRFRSSDKPVDINGNEVKEDVSPLSNTRNTAEENPIGSMMLQPGVQIQLRLGYSNNPVDLEKVFNGVITDVAFSEGTDMVEITAQSFAIELVQNIHGNAKSYGGWLSAQGKTSEILEELLSEPELVHFGRWEGGKPNNGQRSLLKKNWNFFPSPVDDNIFAPTGSRGIFGIFDSTPKYVLYQTTVWDVFQEMTYRHPAYVASAVPYDDKFGPRMTMFFGVPDQMYFSRDPTWEEDNDIMDIKKFIEEAAKAIDSRDAQQKKIVDASVSVNEAMATAVIAGTNSTGPSNNTLDVVGTFERGAIKSIREQWLERQIRNYAKDTGFIRPFRSYHALTSTQHIIANNIQSAQHNTFNVATIQYSQTNASPNENTGGLNFGSLDTFTLLADSGIPDEEKREVFLQFQNCTGYEMAKRYALTTLWKSMKEGYRGSIIIIGNPSIKPHDICYVFDEYSDMFGPIEVEQVVHRFSQETGFITEITPDMVCHVNQESTLSTSDAMGLIVEGGLKQMGLQSLPKIALGANIAQDAAIGTAGVALIAGAAVSASPLLFAGAGLLAIDRAFSPIASMFFNSDENAVGANGTGSLFGLVGAFIFRKQITRTQMAHPMRYSPLVLNNKTMLGGLPTRTIDGGFIQGIKTWFKDTDRTGGLLLDELYDNLSINKWAGHSTGDFSDTILGKAEF